MAKALGHPEEKWRDRVRQFALEGKGVIKKEALKALAKILGVPLAYLQLKTDDHQLDRLSLLQIVAMQRSIDHTKATYRMITDPRFAAGPASGMVPGKARQSGRPGQDHAVAMKMHAHEPTHDVAADRDGLQDHERASNADETGEPVPAVTVPVVDLVSAFSNPLSRAARDWRDANKASRKTAAFSTRVVDGEWRVSIADLSPNKYPLLRTGADDRIFGLTHPATCPIRGIPAGVTLLFESESALQPGDWIITLQPADRNIAEMFFPPDPALIETINLSKTKPIWSDVAEPDPDNPREFRLSAWRFVGQHDAFNCMRVTRSDDPDSEEVVIFYDQIWVAVLEGFVR
ncbi:MAG: hypothetical protein ACXIVE_02200 [Salinarimonas sp.]